MSFRKKPFRVALDISGMSELAIFPIEAFRGVMRYAGENDRWELLSNNINFPYHRHFKSWRDLKKMEVDGLLFTRGTERAVPGGTDYNPGNEDVQAFLRFEIPSVQIIRRDIVVPNSARSAVDDLAIGRMAFQHLHERGYQHFAFYGPRTWEATADRRHSFEEACRSKQLDFYLLNPITYTNPKSPQPPEDTLDAVIDWIEGLPKPVGVFCSNDMRSMYVMDACRELHLNVPNDVGILGVDNNPMACTSFPISLSSVDPGFEEAGYRAAQLLNDIMTGKAARDTQIVLPPRGVVQRESTNIDIADDPEVSKALQYLRQNYCREIKVDEIAKHVGLSRSYIGKRFRDRLGRTIGEELRSLRMAHARKLLEETSLSVNEIAKAIGQNHVTYFVNSFTREHNMPPGRWRHHKTHSNNGDE
jgi:LacI family transcriptional regulator